MRRVGRTGVACVLAVLALGACGERAPLPRACIEAQPEDVVQALAAAPGAVALDDGTRLSQCVAHAIDDAELQALGGTLTAAADRLAARMRAGGADAGAVADADADTSGSDGGRAGAGGDDDGTGAQRAAEQAALQLGFLIGATTRGSARTAGFQGDLVDRIANAAGLDGGPHRAALLRGREAGRRRG
jgi:hypothetical protein